MSRKKRTSTGSFDFMHKMYIFQIKIKWPFNNHDFQNIEFFSLMSITTPNFDQGNLRLVQPL